MKRLDWPLPKNWDRYWPAIKGSLAKIYKPCIRPGCRVCAEGTRHPAYILSFTQKGKRKCMYVPEDLVPLFEKAVKNARKLEELLYSQGPSMLLKYRDLRDAEPKEKTGKKTKSRPKS